ncbi:Arc family DNA-binding protein [Streptomyces acidiscabies]|uniref:Arc family DNA-binding protein n=1 Tax=Streptomyces acidiscabies TaxID=42234 RepID=UPI00095119A4|nr:Arc family DNA-binding protein [Streptomyces acidiscabies]
MIRFALRLPEDLHTRLTAQAATDRRSINSEILHLLEVALTAVAPETPDHPGGDQASPAPLRGKPDSSPAWRGEHPPITW